MKFVWRELEASLELKINHFIQNSNISKNPNQQQPKHTELPKFIGKLDSVSANEGFSASFSARIGGGLPKPELKWFFEEEEIVITEEHYEVTEVEEAVTLTIKNVRAADAGSYFARLVNEAGSVSTNKAQLNVNSTVFFL